MRTEQEFFEWYDNEASEQERSLVDKVGDLGEMFDDMLFRHGTSAYELTVVSAVKDGKTIRVGESLPEELEDFDYTSYFYKVEELPDCDGYYNDDDKMICISPEQLENDTTILHEMIHLHEAVINKLPMYFHDMVYWALYKDLREKIPNLDEIITQHSHVVTGSGLQKEGGTHDILFLLKSFDLDIRQGKHLGTVFAYGREKDFQKYSYIK